MKVYIDYKASLKNQVSAAEDDLLTEESGCFRFFRCGSKAHDAKVKKLNDCQNTLALLTSDKLVSVKDMLRKEVLRKIDEQNQIGAKMKLPEMSREHEDAFMLAHSELKEELQQQCSKMSSDFMYLADQVLLSANKSLITCSNSTNRDKIKKRLDRVSEKLNLFYYIDKDDTHIPFAAYVKQQREKEKTVNFVRKVS